MCILYYVYVHVYIYIYICILIILYHFSNADHVPVATLSSCKAVSGFWWTWNWRYLNLPTTLIFNPLLFQLQSLAPTFGAPEPAPQGDGYRFWKENREQDVLLYLLSIYCILGFTSVRLGSVQWQIIPTACKKTYLLEACAFSFRTLAFCLQGIF